MEVSRPITKCPLSQYDFRHSHVLQRGDHPVGPLALLSDRLEQIDSRMQARELIQLKCA